MLNHRQISALSALWLAVLGISAAGPLKAETAPVPMPYEARPRDGYNPKEKWSDPSSDPAPLKIAPWPMPRPSGRYFYFYTRADQYAPVMDDHNPQMRRLKPETLIRFASLPEPEKTGQTSIRFETVPLSITDPVVRGWIPLAFIGEPLSGDPTGEAYERYRKAVSVYAEIEKKNRPAPTAGRAGLEATMTLRQVLSEFHNEKCALNGKAKTKEEFIQRWDNYAANTMVTARGKQMAKTAKALDLTARTIIFESQKRDQLENNSHPKAEACQWDIIALSIRNRAFRRGETYRESYGAGEMGDVAGVATSPQFNVWRESFTKANPDIFNCFLYRGYDGRAGQTYRGILDQVPQTLGLVADDQPLKDRDVSSRFLIQGDGDPSLKAYTHYYHPRGMGRCNVGQRIAPRLVSGFLRIGKRGQNSDESASLNYNFLSVPIINGMVLGHSDLRVEKSEERRRIYYGYYSLPVYEWKIRVYQKRDVNGSARWVLVPAEEVFDAEVSLVDSRDLSEEFETGKYTCLPDGVMPQCFEGGAVGHDELAARGIRVPLTWFDESHRQKMIASLERLGFAGAKNGFVLPEDYRWKNPTGSPVRISCVSPGMADDSRRGDDRYPAFGGKCDTNIMLFTGVDR